MTDDHLQAHVEPTKTTEKDVFEYDSSLSKDLLNDINMDMFADELGFTDYVPLNEEKKVPATKAPVVDVKLLANGKKRATSASKKPTKTPPKRLLSARPKPPDRDENARPHTSVEKKKHYDEELVKEYMTKKKVEEHKKRIQERHQKEEKELRKHELLRELDERIKKQYKQKYGHIAPVKKKKQKSKEKNEKLENRKLKQIDQNNMRKKTPVRKREEQIVVVPRVELKKKKRPKSTQRSSPKRRIIQSHVIVPDDDIADLIPTLDMENKQAQRQQEEKISTIQSALSKLQVRCKNIYEKNLEFSALASSFERDSHDERESLASSTRSQKSQKSEHRSPQKQEESNTHILSPHEIAQAKNDLREILKRKQQMAIPSFEHVIEHDITLEEWEKADTEVVGVAPTRKDFVKIGTGNLKPHREEKDDHVHVPKLAFHERSLDSTIPVDKEYVNYQPSSPGRTVPLSPQSPVTSPRAAVVHPKLSPRERVENPVEAALDRRAQQIRREVATSPMSKQDISTQYSPISIKLNEQQRALETSLQELRQAADDDNDSDISNASTNTTIEERAKRIESLRRELQRLMRKKQKIELRVKQKLEEEEIKAQIARARADIDNIKRTYDLEDDEEEPSSPFVLNTHTISEQVRKQVVQRKPSDSVDDSFSAILSNEVVQRDSLGTEFETNVSIDSLEHSRSEDKLRILEELNRSGLSKSPNREIVEQRTSPVRKVAGEKVQEHVNKWEDRFEIEKRKERTIVQKAEREQQAESTRVALEKEAQRLELEHQNKIRIENEQKERVQREEAEKTRIALAEEAARLERQRQQNKTRIENEQKERVQREEAEKTRIALAEEAARLERQKLQIQIENEQREREEAEKTRIALAEEAARLERQKALDQERRAKELTEKRLAEEKRAKEQAELKRLEEERARVQLAEEAARIERENAERERKEREAHALRQKQQREREAQEQKEKEERERLEQERLEKERLQKQQLMEAVKRAEQEKRKQIERERIEAEEKQREEQERQEYEKRVREEKERLEKERLAIKQREEREKLEREEKERKEREHALQLQREREEQERREHERLEEERKKREQAAHLRAIAEQERKEQERLNELAVAEELDRLQRIEDERVRKEQERLEKEREEKERQLAIQLQKEREEQEQREREENDRREREIQLRKEREAQEQKEKEEQERLELEREEQERKEEAARLEKEREQAEKLDDEFDEFEAEQFDNVKEEIDEQIEEEFDYDFESETQSPSNKSIDSLQKSHIRASTEFDSLSKLDDEFDEMEDVLIKESEDRIKKEQERLLEEEQERKRLEEEERLEKQRIEAERLEREKEEKLQREREQREEEDRKARELLLQQERERHARLEQEQKEKEEQARREEEQRQIELRMEEERKALVEQQRLETVRKQEALREQARIEEQIRLEKERIQAERIENEKKEREQKELEQKEQLRIDHERLLKLEHDRQLELEELARKAQDDSIVETVEEFDIEKIKQDTLGKEYDQLVDVIYDSFVQDTCNEMGDILLLRSIRQKHASPTDDSELLEDFSGSNDEDEIKPYLDDEFESTLKLELPEISTKRRTTVKELRMDSKYVLEFCKKALQDIDHVLDRTVPLLTEQQFSVIMQKDDIDQKGFDRLLFDSINVHISEFNRLVRVRELSSGLHGYVFGRTDRRTVKPVKQTLGEFVRTKLKQALEYSQTTDFVDFALIEMLTADESPGVMALIDDPDYEGDWKSMEYETEKIKVTVADQIVDQLLLDTVLWLNKTEIKRNKR